MIDYKHHSPSSLNLFAASRAMWVLEKILDRKQPVGAPAHRGTATEAGVAYGLINPDASQADCINEAFTSYDTITALTTDRRTEDYRKTIPNMVAQGLEELRPYGIPDKLQGKVECNFPELKYPIIGYFDFMWTQRGLVVDLKTTEKMPSQIRISHARQVALYSPTDNFDAKLCYVTPRKCITYNLENIGEHRQALVQIALRVERFLTVGKDDPQYYIDNTIPDIDAFYWTNPQARQLAYEYWKI